MTGWTDAISFAAAFIFSGFQTGANSSTETCMQSFSSLTDRFRTAFATGNTVQLAAAIARLFSGPDRDSGRFHPADRLALCSLISFVLGASLGQIGDRIGPKTRLWTMGATALQAGMMAGAFIAIIVSNQASFATDRGDVSWSDAPGLVGLGLMSAGMGLQGIVAKRLHSHYGTTVVLTTIWCELVADPGLFRISQR